MGSASGQGNGTCCQSDLIARKRTEAEIVVSIDYSRRLLTNLERQKIALAESNYLDAPLDKISVCSVTSSSRRSNTPPPSPKSPHTLKRCRHSSPISVCGSTSPKSPRSPTFSQVGPEYEIDLDAYEMSVATDVTAGAPAESPPKAQQSRATDSDVAEKQALVLSSDEIGEGLLSKALPLGTDAAVGDIVSTIPAMLTSCADVSSFERMLVMPENMVANGAMAMAFTRHVWPAQIPQLLRGETVDIDQTCLALMALEMSDREQLQATHYGAADRSPEEILRLALSS